MHIFPFYKAGWFFTLMQQAGGERVDGRTGTVLSLKTHVIIAGVTSVFA
jgi:hypothetical protein